MTHILFVWAVAAVTSTSGGIPAYKEREWRLLGEFRTQAACEQAAAQLNLKDGWFRCVSTGKPS